MEDIHPQQQVRSPLPGDVFDNAVEPPGEQESSTDAENSLADEGRRPTTGLTGLISRCTSCGEDLTAMRYDCESCYANMCSTCHKSHPEGHKLWAVLHAAAVTTLTSSSDAGLPHSDDGDARSGRASSAGAGSVSSLGQHSDSVEALNPDPSPDEEGDESDMDEPQSLRNPAKSLQRSQRNRQAFKTIISIQIFHEKPIPNRVQVRIPYPMKC